MNLSNRQKEIITQIFEIPFIKVNTLVENEPHKVLVFVDYCMDSLKRQLKHCTEKKQDNDLISTYQEKIAELVVLQNQIAENIDSKHLKTQYVC